MINLKKQKELPKKPKINKEDLREFLIDQSSQFSGFTKTLINRAILSLDKLYFNI